MASLLSTTLQISLLGLFGGLVSASPLSAVVNGATYSCNNVITRNVAVIGGGSAGTYTAVYLGDYNQSVVVIEQTDRLGGNTQTYTDPATGATIDYGVEAFHPIPTTEDYFTRFNISYYVGGYPSSSGPSYYYDFKHNHLNTTYNPDATAAYEAAFAAYAAQVFQYPYLDYGFDLPSPVPADLLLSFGDFVKKYSLDAIVPFAWLLCQGIGNILQTPTLYVMKYLGLSVVEDFETGFLFTTNHDNSALYQAIQTYLGSKVLYNSNILAVERSSSGVSIVVQTPSGITLVKAQKLVVSIQPSIATLAPWFDLTAQETSLFSQFQSSEYFTGLLRNTGLPANLTLTNYDPTLPYSIPATPNIYIIEPTGVQDLTHVFAISTTGTPDATIAQQVITSVENINIPGKVKTTPSFAVYSNHKPFELKVSSAAIQNGFYNQLNSLQGEHNTWWISATFHEHDSSLLWRFAAGLTPGIAAAA